MGKTWRFTIKEEDVKKPRGESFRPGHAHLDKRKYSRKRKHKNKENLHE